MRSDGVCHRPSWCSDLRRSPERTAHVGDRCYTVEPRCPALLDGAAARYQKPSPVPLDVGPCWSYGSGGCEEWLTSSSWVPESVAWCLRPCSPRKGMTWSSRSPVTSVEGPVRDTGARRAHRAPDPGDQQDEADDDVRASPQRKLVQHIAVPAVHPPAHRERALGHRRGQGEVVGHRRAEGVGAPRGLQRAGDAAARGAGEAARGRAVPAGRRGAACRSA